MEATVTYQCPNCGAGLAFDAASQKFNCEFCLSSFTEQEISASQPEELLREQEQARAEYNDALNEYSCPNCGAEVVADEHTAADYCYYCHNPVVLGGKLSGQMRPHRIVPFRYDKEEAKKRFFKFAKSKWFVPNGFFAASQVEKITGVYYPFWITDADTEGDLEADATRLRLWRIGNVEYTETSKFKIQRSGEIHFEDITTSAFSEADKAMLEGVLPYPSEALQEFSMPYLSGYVAKKRDVEREDLNEEIKRRMNDYATTLLKRTVLGYNTVSARNLDLKIHKSHWEYSLLPIWMLTYRDRKDRLYTYALNGYTGKVYGELPVSIGKLMLLLGAIAVPIATLLTLLGGVLF